MENYNENLKVNSPKVLSSNESGSSPDLTLLSPLSKSRYGRTRKPKITEDFYNIDIVFESAKDFIKKSPRTPQLIKPTKARSLSPKKTPTSTIAKQTKDDFEHVTGDELLTLEPITELPHNELNSKAIHNFFKRESGMSILQNASINNEEPKNKAMANALDLASVDVSQVLKIISAKTTDENITTEPRPATKPVLKTYSNKRKSYIKTSVVESFGLPDTPIFPVENDKLTEPKRIKSLDVAPPASENDINLVDKKLLDTPWKIASMDADIPDLDILLDTVHNYKEESPAKLLNHSSSIFDDSIELETVVNSQETIKNKHLVCPAKQNSSPFGISKHTNDSLDKKQNSTINTVVPDCSKLLPKLKYIVQTKILRNSMNMANKADAEKDETKPVKALKKQKVNKSIEMKKPNQEEKSDEVPKNNPPITNNEKIEESVSPKLLIENSSEKSKQKNVEENPLKKSITEIAEENLSPEKLVKEVAEENLPNKLITEVAEEDLSLKKSIKEATEEDNVEKNPSLKKSVKEMAEEIPPKKSKKEIAAENLSIKKSAAENVSLKKSIKEVAEEILPTKKSKKEIAEEDLSPKKSMKEIAEENLATKTSKKEIVEENSSKKSKIEITEENPSSKKTKKEKAEENVSINKSKKEIAEENPSPKKTKKEIAEENISVNKSKKEMAEENPPTKKTKKEIAEENPSPKKTKKEIAEENISVNKSKKEMAEENPPSKKTKKEIAEENPSPKKTKKEIAEENISINKSKKEMAEENPPSKKTKKEIAEENLPIKKSKKETAEENSPPKKTRKQIAEENLSMKKSKIESAEENSPPKKTRKQIAEENLSIKKSKKEIVEENPSPKKTKKEIAEENVSIKKSKKEIAEEDPSPKKTKKEIAEENVSIKKSKKEIAEEDPPPKRTKKEIAEENLSIKKLKKKIAEENSSPKKTKKEIVEENVSIKKSKKEIAEEDPPPKKSKKEIPEENPSPKKTKKEIAEDNLSNNKSKKEIAEKNPSPKKTNKEIAEEKRSIKKSNKQIWIENLRKKSKKEIAEEDPFPKKSKKGNEKTLKKLSKTEKTEEKPPKKFLRSDKVKENTPLKNALKSGKVLLKTASKNETSDDDSPPKKSPKILRKSTMLQSIHGGMVATVVLKTSEFKPKLPIKKVEPETSDSDSDSDSQQEVAVKKNKDLSPLTTLTNKRKHLESPIKSHSVPKVHLSRMNFELKIKFVPRRGRSSGRVETDKVDKPSDPVLRKRISKSADVLEKSSKDTVEVKNEEVPIKVEEVSDESVEYAPSNKQRSKASILKKKTEKNIVLKKIISSQEDKPFARVKREPGSVSVGDLMWAKIGGHPYWPCLIVEEPATKHFMKKYFAKNKCHFMYHVRFFGDRGRRSWVHGISMYPYTSKFDLNNLFHQSKNKGNFIVKPSALAKWKVAVDEAEAQLSCTVAERLDFFEQIIIAQQKLKKEVKKKAQLELKKEQLHTHEETSEYEARQNRSKSLPPTSGGTDKENLEKDESESDSITDDAQRKTRSQSFGNGLGEKVKNKTIVKNMGEKSNSDVESINAKEQSENGSEESNEPFLKNPWKILENVDGNSEFSLSDTDSVSKSSSSTPIPNSFQDQISRQRRNNLFRGVSRDRVCQICKLSENIFKCKGACNGVYHYDCALKEPIKDEEELPPDSTQTNGDNSAKPSSKTLSLAEQIDMKMKEVMQDLQNDTRYADSTTDYSSSEESTCNLIPQKTDDSNLVIRHVTADHISFIHDSCEDVSSNTTKISTNNENEKRCEEKSVVSTQNTDFQCWYCSNKVEPPCYACGKEKSSKSESLRQKCSLRVCGRYYHPKCLKLWPQTQWSLISTEKHKDSDVLLDTFVCPSHVCHTCASDDPHGAVSRCGSKKVAKCLRCPATYHTTNYCIPAGTEVLSVTQIICPRHFLPVGYKRTKTKPARTVNTPWCFICSKGGDLICCETCPTSVHTECLTVNFLDDDTFICEDCETGRFPLYDEVVWVKLGSYRWWPAVILFPNEIPQNVKLIPHNGGEFVVKFFGTHDHYWVGRGRVFLFQEGDKGHCSPSKKRVDTWFKKSIEEATSAHNIKKIFRKNKEAELRSIVKPPPYIKVKMNRAVGNARVFDGNVSNTTSCECNPSQENPCGPDSDCINRLLLTECDPNVCRAKDKCNNQRFEKRQYPPMEPYKTQGRGWGLKTLAPIAKGDFVIEYVGEIIDDQEYQRRIRKMHEQKDENYYFLIIDKERIIDAGPKGNLARFMNHCCQPNCETQKWTVNGDTRVGLFAIDDVPADSELTFNYNLECIGKEKKICKCGAPNCSGFIGVKVKDESQRKIKKSNSIKKKKALVSEVLKSNGPCFICGKNGDVGPCHNKICTKFYHSQCLNLESWPEGKWVCPWHNCNVCTKRTIRCCVKCTNSYCPVHSEGNVRYDKLLGFVCSEHDSTKEPQEPEDITQAAKKLECSDVTEETDVTSTTCDEIDPDPTSSEGPTLISLDLGASLTSTPIKKSNVTESLEELENNLVREKLEIPESSTPEEPSEKTAKGVKRKKYLKKKRPPKKLKLSNSIINKPTLRFSTNNLVEVVTTHNEVKLCASVPVRHLRTRSDANKIANKRFLRQQSVLEKDLPIRKRSRPRCEATS